MRKLGSEGAGSDTVNANCVELCTDSGMTAHTTLSSSFGKIWNAAPDVNGGFISSVKHPTSTTRGLARATPFTAVDFSANGEIVTTVNQQGVVVLLYITKSVVKT